MESDSLVQRYEYNMHPLEEDHEQRSSSQIVERLSARLEDQKRGAIITTTLRRR